MRQLVGSSSKWIGYLVTLGLLFSLFGCANKAQTGAGVGALGGALAGSLLGPSKNKEQFALIGAAIGGVLGYVVGNEMDKGDRERLENTFETGPSHKSAHWVNPDSGNEYAVTPKPAFRSGGRQCREAEIDSWINGKQETVVTTACRRDDGRWEIQGG